MTPISAPTLSAPASAERTFANLIVCDSQASPFVDRYAQFGVVFEAGRPLGPGALQLRSCVRHQSVADPLLTLWHESAGRIYRSTRRTLESLPWQVLETGELTVAEGEVTVSAQHTFLDETHLFSEFSLQAHHREVCLAPLFCGQLTRDLVPPPGALVRYGIGDQPSRRGFARVIPRGIVGGLVSSGDAYLPSPAIRVLCTAGEEVRPVVSLAPPWIRRSEDSAADQLELSRVVDRAVHFSFRFPELTVRPDSPCLISFVTELSVATYLHRELEWVDVGPPSMNVAAAASRAAFLDRVAVNRPPRVMRERATQAWRARWALTRTGYRAGGPAGEFGSLTASTCVANSGVFTRAFFWDALFSSAAMAETDPQHSRGAILAQFVRQTEEGYCPEHVFNYTVPGRSFVGAPQAPVASWAVEKYLAANPNDVGFLEEIYPVLVRNHRYWETCGDRDGDGLAEWTWTGQTADNSPLWDEVKPVGMMADCNWLPPIASVQLNSFLFRDATLLAGLADTLGHDAEAARFRARADGLERALLEVCYVPDERRFWDYNHATRRHTRVRTFYMFWPLWAGIRVPDKARRDLIERVLLDPRQFFGPIPFPSVAYDEPTYESGGYWRGRAWPQITYWLLEMLAAEGYTREADEAAARFCAAYDREPSFPENVNTDPSVYAAGGVPDYNWGIAAYLLIASGRYRKGRS